MLSSLSDNSIKQYDVCLKKWYRFCHINNIDVFEASIPQVMYFLTENYNSGSQYGTLNSCRSALSLILGRQIGNDDRIKRLFKGFFRLRPPLPKYNVTWDTSLVLDHLSSWFPNEELSLENLSKKLATLLALVTAHRVQTLSKINIQNIEIKTNEISIKIPDLIKTSRPGSLQPILVLPFFREKPQICPVSTLCTYLSTTHDLRNNHTSLFVSLKKPHSAVTAQTLSRWIKSTLQACGIDTSTFTAHSTRHAASSRASKLGISLDLIRKTAGWSGTSKTFGKFYNRIILTNNDNNQHLFARSIIDD